MIGINTNSIVRKTENNKGGTNGTVLKERGKNRMKNRSEESTCTVVQPGTQQHTPSQTKELIACLTSFASIDFAHI